jgi:pyridoxine kinase
MRRQPRDAALEIQMAKPEKILLIGDLPCYGRMAVNAMMPVLSHMGFDVSVLPTALVSNNFAYGKFDVLDTTQFMKSTLGYWDELGFGFDAVYTGFIASKAQADLVVDCCRRFHERGCPVFTDPIMGDHGELYNGVTQESVDNMRRLVAVADFILPNWTEACYLACPDYRGGEDNRKNAAELGPELAKITSACSIITSARDEKGGRCVRVEGRGDGFSLPYAEVGREFHGTGDLFAALFIGRMLSTDDLRESVLYAMNGVSAMIKRNLDNENVFDGLPIGKCLDLI